MGSSRRVLDPADCLALVKEHGSYGATQRFLASKGIVSQITGRAFTKSAVYASAKKARGYAKYVRNQKKREARTKERIAKLAKSK